jgi:hypothetical protein
MWPSKTFWISIHYRSRRVHWNKFFRWFGWAVVTAIAVVVVIYLVYLVFVPVSDTIAEHDVGTITGADRAAALQAARDAVRNRLLAALAGLVALGALVYTARTFGLSREGQVTDRFAKAIGQLGDTSLEVRVGAIYALELIVRDSPRNQQAVMDLLAAFAREQSKAQTAASAKGVPSAKRSGHIMLPDVHDVHAAVEVIGRRRHDRNKPVDLRKTDLAGAHLAWVHLPKADLTGADLTSAHLDWANLAGADLTGADLTGAHLEHARLYKAILKDAHLNGAHLDQANLAWAHLDGADLTGAHLYGAVLGAATFHYAHLEYVDLREVKVPDAVWKSAYLDGASWPTGRHPGQGPKEPEGWECDPHGHLKPAPDSDPAGAARH